MGTLRSPVHTAQSTRHTKPGRRTQHYTVTHPCRRGCRHSSASVRCSQCAVCRMHVLKPCANTHARVGKSDDGTNTRINAEFHTDVVQRLASAGNNDIQDTTTITNAADAASCRLQARANGDVNACCQAGVVTQTQIISDTQLPDAHARTRTSQKTALTTRSHPRVSRQAGSYTPF